MIGASPSLHAAARAEAAEILGDALGPAGLVAGQMRDLSSISADTSPADVELTYVLKTAVLFAASLELGALAADAAIRERQAVYRFGLEIGVAFQIYDDLADRTAGAAMLGKDAGRDGDKPTLVSLLGPNAAEDAADQRIAAAMSGIASDVGDSCELVVYVRDLQHKLKARLGSSH